MIVCDPPSHFPACIGFSIICLLQLLEATRCLQSEWQWNLNDDHLTNV